MFKVPNPAGPYPGHQPGAGHQRPVPQDPRQRRQPHRCRQVLGLIRGLISI